MIIGVPKEIKNMEFRVGMTPQGVEEMIKHGHRVYVQKTAGEGSGFSDGEYEAVGATMLDSNKEVYDIAEMIVKVKEPIEPEYELIHEGQVLFTYFHFAADRALTEAMVKAKPVCIAYETVRAKDGTLPLLIPMSEVAGRMAIQNGAHFLEKTFGGKGIVLGGVPGVKPAKVLILGGGRVGSAAARVAAGMGADVTVADKSLPCLRHLAETMPANVKTLYASSANIKAELPSVDLVIGSVLIPGDVTPHLITKDMLKLMQPGTVLVDVAIDQGGCFETSHPTKHTDPVYTIDGIVHYAVANIPGAAPRTSTFALSNATLPYALQIADKGWKKAVRENPDLVPGVNMVNGDITLKPVADCWGFEYKELVLD